MGFFDFYKTKKTNSVSIPATKPLHGRDIGSNISQLLHNIQDSNTTPIDRHFDYIAIQDYYYKRRDEDPENVDRCIKYCWEDIHHLPEVEQQYINEKLIYLEDVFKRKRISKSEYLKKYKQYKTIGFDANIPAFERLAIIYEKRNEFSQCIEICDLALDYYKKNPNRIPDYFVNKKERCLKRLSSNCYK